VCYQAPCPPSITDDLQLNHNLAVAGSFPTGLVAPAPTLSANGQRITVGPQFASWISDPVNGIRPGDLVLFKSVAGGSAIQTVTAVGPTTVDFQPGSPTDWFNFNQPGAAAGSIMSLQEDQGNGVFQFGVISVARVTMLTYYVDPSVGGTPRLVRQQNAMAPQALAGVVEDMGFTYDLVDGQVNPVQIESLPYTTLTPPIITFNANQIRKVNIHMGVRSEEFSQLHKDFMRHHITTTVSLRNLAFVDKYK
jgi:hypothetical protein